MLKLLDLFIDFLLLIGEGDRKIRPTQRVSLEKYRSRLYTEQGRKCKYCGASKRKANFQIDHVDPVVMGGSNDYDNLQLLCPPCNQRKGMQSDAEFRERYKSLLPKRGIPQSVISPERFRAVTRQTTESESVRTFRKTKYWSPKDRIRGGAIGSAFVVAIALLILLASLGATDALLLLLPIILGGVIGGGIYLRAGSTGKLIEPS